MDVMTKHVIVDGSNLATEGRAQPSLAQLNEAVLSFIEENPNVKVTVVVDATFGHRINKKELAEFNEAVDNNELVAPPAGAVGRGDAFVLSIADKVNAAVLSNDSYQEFHGKYPWLFDEGRLIGGKPVPHIGWVFVERLPVRGSTSRRAMKAGGKVVAKEPSRASAEASKPMPVPKAPPPSAKRRSASESAKKAKTVSAKTVVEAKPTNTADVMAYLTFVENHPVGSAVKGVVDGFAANGVIVKVGEIRGYAPLRLLGNPIPRRARDVFALGEAVTLKIAGYTPARRSVDLGVPDIVAALLDKKATPAKASKTARVSKATKVKKAAKSATIRTASTSTDAPKSAKKAPVKKSSIQKSAAKKAVKKSATTGSASSRPIKKAARKTVAK